MSTIARACAHASSLIGCCLQELQQKKMAAIQARGSTMALGCRADWSALEEDEIVLAVDAQVPQSLVLKECLDVAP